MTNVVVAFSKQEDARSIKNILMKNGFRASVVCTSGAQALAMMGDLGGGILVCGFRLADMLSTELLDDMPEDFTMLLVASPDRLSGLASENLVLLPTPLKVHSLLEAAEMIAEAQERRRRKRKQQPKKRDEKELALIGQAKQLLMEQNGMTEEEAHRYIQKTSMDSGVGMLETAQMIISLKYI